jgi:hypothetical protein
VQSWHAINAVCRTKLGAAGANQPLIGLVLIIAARLRLLLSAKQDLLRTVDSFAIIETTIREFWQAGGGKPPVDYR